MKQIQAELAREIASPVQCVTNVGRLVVALVMAVVKVRQKEAALSPPL
jgi:hypothetical protein